ncbi:Hypothetical predicted protein [Lecanosticta acicola]|uniref:Uncharacterized protein n=1 Tax=Lecanosticta acicola TaxID=111012 RepID=A0AAI8Z6J5_9PEZI|nr:Hypothetical predicted protein [Lecanosticta acicola]
MAAQNNHAVIRAALQHIDTNLTQHLDAHSRLRLMSAAMNDIAARGQFPWKGKGYGEGAVHDGKSILQSLKAAAAKNNRSQLYQDLSGSILDTVLLVGSRIFSNAYLVKIDYTPPIVHPTAAANPPPVPNNSASNSNAQQAPPAASQDIQTDGTHGHSHEDNEGMEQPEEQGEEGGEDEDQGEEGGEDEDRGDEDGEGLRRDALADASVSYPHDVESQDGRQALHGKRAREEREDEDEGMAGYDDEAERPKKKPRKFLKSLAQDYKNPTRAKYGRSPTKPKTVAKTQQRVSLQTSSSDEQYQTRASRQPTRYNQEQGSGVNTHDVGDEMHVDNENIGAGLASRNLPFKGQDLPRNRSHIRNGTGIGLHPPHNSSQRSWNDSAGSRLKPSTSQNGKEKEKRKHSEAFGGNLLESGDGRPLPKKPKKWPVMPTALSESESEGHELTSAKPQRSQKLERTKDTAFDREKGYVDDRDEDEEAVEDVNLGPDDEDPLNWEEDEDDSRVPRSGPSLTRAPYGDASPEVSGPYDTRVSKVDNVPFKPAGKSRKSAMKTRPGAVNQDRVIAEEETRQHSEYEQHQDPSDVRRRTRPKANGPYTSKTNVSAQAQSHKYKRNAGSYEDGTENVDSLAAAKNTKPSAPKAGRHLTESWQRAPSAPEGRMGEIPGQGEFESRGEALRKTMDDLRKRDRTNNETTDALQSLASANEEGLAGPITASDVTVENTSSNVPIPAIEVNRPSETPIMDAKDIADAVHILDEKIRKAVSSLFASTEGTAPPILNFKPSGNLVDVYKSALGEDWLSGAGMFAMHCNDARADDLLRALIWNMLGSLIFLTDTPWRSARDLYDDDSPIRKYLAPIIDLNSKDGAASFDTMCRQAVLAQYRDENFINETMLPSAHVAADKMALVLMEHLNALPQNFLHSQWRTKLQRLFADIAKAAYALKARMDGPPNQARFIWFNRRSLPDDASEIALRKGSGDSHMDVVITLVPAVVEFSSQKNRRCYRRAEVVCGRAINDDLSALFSS